MDKFNEIALPFDMDQVSVASEVTELTDLTLASVGGGIGDVVHA